MNGQSRKREWELRCHEPAPWRPSESGTVSATRNPLCIRLMFEKRPIQQTDVFVSDLVSIGTDREGERERFCVSSFFLLPRTSTTRATRQLVSSDFEGGSSEGERDLLSFVARSGPTTIALPLIPFNRVACVHEIMPTLLDICDAPNKLH